MVLWTIFAVLTTAALAAVLWPFLRPRKELEQAAAYDTAVFKDQLEEIDAEQERGVISRAEADAARTEVSRRLLAAARAGKSKVAAASSGQAGNVPALALVCGFLCVPVTSSALYLIYGSPALPDRPLSARLSQSADNQTVDALLARVEARLREHPNDGRGWEVIAPVYMKQHRFTDAANAFGKALRLLGETPERLVDYGNALVLANDGVVTEPARKALQKAVAVDGSLIRAHFWLAVAEEQDGRFAAAAEAWRALLRHGDAGAPWHTAVRERLAAVEQRLQSARGENVQSENGEKSGEGRLKGPSQEDTPAARDMSPADRTAMIKQMVAGLAERLKSDGGSVQEWTRLVRSYAVLGNTDAASQALSDARGVFAKDPEALASLAKLAKSLGL